MSKRGPYKTKDPVERFWSKVDKSGDCWIYTGYIQQNGYGLFCIRKKRMGAHRYSWELANGSIPDGLFICHKCDNPPCVNPDHLFLGTPKDNMLDAWNKGHLDYIVDIGKKQKGEKNSSSKVSDDDAKEIKTRYKSGETQQSIADDFEITQAAVSYIVRGGWTHTGDHVIKDHVRGERQGNSKLTDKQIVEIRQRCQKRGDQTRLAIEYGVSQQLISNIVRRKNWSHI